MLRDYNSQPAGALQVQLLIPPKEARLLTKHVCRLGVARKLVRPDGSLTKANSGTLTTLALRQIGAVRFQTLVNNDLAVSRYHLAHSTGTATTWDRCVARLFGLYDSLASKPAQTPRAKWVRISRLACTLGLKRGLVPPDGAPSGTTTNTLVRLAAKQLGF